ncbi:MAG: diguanylate cyclase [Eubacterium sp.]|nr:diguanylate cyclase [Eubacterium sp.]
MIDLRSVYIANGVGIFLILVLRYAASTRILRRQTEDKLFVLMLYGVMTGCFMEAFSYTIDGKLFAGARAFNYIANTYLYTVNLLLPLCLLFYVELGLYRDPKRIWKYYKPHIMIGVFMFVMTIMNFFIPIAYYITEQNIYERKPFSYVYYIVILFYCLTAMWVTHKYQKETGAKPFLNIMVFLVPILVGAGLQFAFYGLSLAWLSAAIGLTGLFMMQQNEMAYVDALADTYNRQYLNTITSSWINRGLSFAGVMIDVDRFKDINDNLGHSEGDRVLRDVASILKSARSKSELVFRFAGDEFVVLKLTEKEHGLDDYMCRVNKFLDAYNAEHFASNPYKLSLSYGTGLYTGGDLDRFMKIIDDRMYTMKSSHHSGDRRRKTDRENMK